MTPYPKWPSDLHRRRNNLRLIAERTGWPDGVLQGCVDLEDRYPGWYVSWMPENINAGFERPAGYWATNNTIPQHHVEAFRTDLRELAEVLADEIPEHDYGTSAHLRPCAWCVAHTPGRRPVKL
jgi:hypothetical protein